MNTSPTVDDLLAGLIVAIGDDIVPNVTNAKAAATAMMMQALLQSIRQVLPVYHANITDEHNAMTRTLRETADVLGGAIGPEADRIRARAAELGAWVDLPAPPDQAATMAAHRTLSEALWDTIADLDVLQRAGDHRADAALQVVRGHLGPRYMRDVATVVVGAGFIGRS